MIYGLWLSATGVVANSHQVDVIANNLANVETSGFKRQFTAFRERLPEGKEDPSQVGDRFFDNMGGGALLSPAAYDTTAGQLEQTNRRLDLAVNGEGFFKVRDESGSELLTRNGNFALDRDGNIVLDSNKKLQLLDNSGQAINLRGITGDVLEIADDGTIEHDGATLGRIGLYTVPDPAMLRPIGATLLKVPPSMAVRTFEGQVVSGYLERSNVDPAVELTKLMEAQRMLEANSNMIRYQDQTMGRLVNDVGRVA